MYNPTNKTETGYTCGTTNSKPLALTIVIDQSEILSCSQVQFITLFLGGAIDLSPATACWTNLVLKN
jgi:hypothetical protein